MRRQEFIDNVNDVEALKEFCEEYDFDDDYFGPGDDGMRVLTRDQYNDLIDHHISDRVFDYTWEDILDYLSALPKSSDYEYFMYNSDDDEYSGFSRYDFDELKNSVLERADDYGYFESEDEDDDDVDDEVTDEELEHEDQEDQPSPVMDYGSIIGDIMKKGATA